MSTVINTAERYFTLLSKAQQQGSIVDNLVKLGGIAAGAVNRDDKEGALCALRGLESLFSIMRPLVDNRDGHKSLMEIMLLRKQILELAEENALLRGEEPEAAAVKRALESLNEFFCAGIADLDPDV